MSAPVVLRLGRAQRGGCSVQHTTADGGHSCSSSQQGLGCCGTLPCVPLQGRSWVVGWPGNCPPPPHTHPHHPICPARFQSGFGAVGFYPLFLLLGGSVHRCRLEVFNLLFDLYGSSLQSLPHCLSHRRLQTWTSQQCVTARTLATLRWMD